MIISIRREGIKKLIILFILLNFFDFVSIGFSKTLIVSGHHDYPPFMKKEENSKLVGVSFKIVKMVLDELNINYKIKHMGPWNRVQNLAKSGAVDIIVGIYFNKEREKYLDYSDSYAEDSTSVFVLKSKVFPFRNKFDLIGKIGTTIFGDSFGQELDVFINSKLRLNRSYKISDSFRMLDDGVADYMIWGYFPARINAVKLGYENRIKILAKNLSNEGIYIGFSKKSKLNHLLPKVNTILSRIKKAGTIDRLLEEAIRGSKK